MLRKLLTRFHRSRPSNPQPDLVQQITDRFIAKVAEDSRQSQLAAASPDQLTPKEVKFIFEFVRDLLIDWAIERYSAFDLDLLKAQHPEKFWSLVEFGARVEKLTQPVTADTLQSFLHQYASAIGNAAALAQDREQVG